MFNSFKKPYENMDLLKCRYDKSNVSSASYTDMEEYYSADDIKKHSVVGIKIKRL